MPLRQHSGKDLQVQFAALMQTIPDIDGTEIILETTGNSYNDFYKLWRRAESGAAPDGDRAGGHRRVYGV